MVSARVDLQWLGAGQAQSAIELFDDEFIHGRGRTISLATRYADVLNRGDCIVAATIEGTLAGALLVAPFTWITAVGQWRGAMLGAVCTARAHRGRGIAGTLLSEAERRCRERECDFMVLWAADPRLYARAGWISADRGMLGSARGAGEAGADLSECAEASVDLIEQLRNRLDENRVQRTPDAYRRLLPPAQRMRMIVESPCYALVGEQVSTAYVYELAGDAEGINALWQRLTRSYQQIYVNVQHETTVERTLLRCAGAQWKPQALTLWKPLRPAPFDDWYIPFFDRI